MLAHALAFGVLLSGPSNADDMSSREKYSFCTNWVTQAEALNPDFVRYFPGENGWMFTPGDFSPLPSPTDRDIEALRRLVTYLSSKGTKTVIVVPPTRGLVASGAAGALRNRYAVANDDSIRRSYRSAIANLRSTGATVPDLLAGIDEAKLPAINHFYRSQDAHWRAEGAQLSAKFVADTVKKAVDLSSFPKKSYVTKMTATDPYRVSLLDALSKICGKTVQAEIEPRYVTEQVGDDAGAGGLLESSKTPVVLVGTSFSRPDAAYNFSGFLSEYLAVDVLNVAIAGGGLETSMLSYLGSRDFADAPPAVLIWEVRPFELPTADLIDQLMATLAGGCAADKALLTRSVPLQRGVTPLITLDQKQRSALKGPLYVDIAARDTGLNKYTLRLSYTDFTEEDVEIDMTRAAFPPDHYFHPLPADRLKTLDSVSLRPAARSSGKVTVSVCPISRTS